MVMVNTAAEYRVNGQGEQGKDVDGCSKHGF